MYIHHCRWGIPVEGIEHLDGDKDREGHGHWVEVSKHFTFYVSKQLVVRGALQVVALEHGRERKKTQREGGREKTLKMGNSVQPEAEGVWSHQLVERDLWTSAVDHEPPGGSCHRCHAHIYPNDQVA